MPVLLLTSKAIESRVRPWAGLQFGKSIGNLYNSISYIILFVFFARPLDLTSPPFHSKGAKNVDSWFEAVDQSLDRYRDSDGPHCNKLRTTTITLSIS